ncbi:hypothetical protein [Aquipseudomonas alcaligenes]|nr:hypothetical protein [Pseudomonas alcaligenes]
MNRSMILSALHAWSACAYPVLAFWALWHCRHARPPDALAA